MPRGSSARNAWRATRALGAAAGGRASAKGSAPPADVAVVWDAWLASSSSTRWSRATVDSATVTSPRTGSAVLSSTAPVSSLTVRDAPRGRGTMRMRRVLSSRDR